MYTTTRRASAAIGIAFSCRTSASASLGPSAERDCRAASQRSSRGREVAGLGLRDSADARQGQSRGKLAVFNEHYSPKIVGYLNDYKLAVVKVLGEFVWHKHDETDDFFLVLRGHLTIQLRDGDVELSEGELFVVPRGVEHCPKAEEEAHVLLIEPEGTLNTGDAGGPLTAQETRI